MLPVIAAALGVGWLVRSARAEAKEERDTASDLVWDLEEIFEELEDLIGNRIAVLDAEGQERANYKGRVHRVSRSKGLVVLDVTRQKQHGPARAQEKEFKVWRVRLDESFVELD